MNRQRILGLLLLPAVLMIGSFAARAEVKLPLGHQLARNPNPYFIDARELQRRLALSRRYDGKALSGSEETESSGGIMYVMGVADSAQGSGVACPFNPESHQPIFNVVIKYMADHPERLSASAGVVVVEALAAAFPCSKVPN